METKILVCELIASEGKVLINVMSDENGIYEKDGSRYSIGESKAVVCVITEVDNWIEVNSLEQFIEENGYSKIEE